jgi:hypothetical protein
MKARFLWATVIALILLSLPALVLAQPPIVPSTGPSGEGVEGAPLGSPDALWDQPGDGYRGVASAYFPDQGWGAYSADDFMNAAPWNIKFIFVDGIAGPGQLSQADTLHWFIYPDAGGVPAGYPGTGGHLWSYSCKPSAPAVTISGAMSDQATLDIVKAQGTPLHLPPGTYWLCFYPSLDFGLYGRWWWETAGTTNLAAAHLIDPWNQWGYPSWTPWPTVAGDPSVYDAAFRLEGSLPAPPIPPKYLHSTDGLFNLTDPIGTQWHELYPLFCREYHLGSWNDTNGDGFLSPSDQIDMYQKPDGEVRWYHVDEVTITLFLTPLERGEPMYIEYEGGYNLTILKNPVGTQWHEIYPVFCREYELMEWDPRVELDFCYEILLRDKETGLDSNWHVEEVAVDIVVTIKPPPVGGEAYPVNKASLLAPWIAVGVVLAGGAIWYVLRRRRTQS